MPDVSLTRDEHPSFPNPSLIEALCEIRFQSSPEKPWAPSMVGDLFLAVKDEFPHMEPLQAMNVAVQVGPMGLAQKVVPSPMRARYKDAGGKKLIQIGEGVLSANYLEVYPGWETMRDHVRYAWEHASQILSPASITRVGLRYINAVPLGSEDELAAAWFVANAYLPSTVVNSARGILFRSDFQFDAHNRMIIQLADRPADDRFGHGSVVFDIDRIREEEMCDVNTQNLLSICESLHSDVWRAFSESLTVKYRHYLEGHR